MQWGQPNGRYQMGHEEDVEALEQERGQAAALSEKHRSPQLVPDRKPFPGQNHERMPVQVAETGEQGENR